MTQPEQCSPFPNIRNLRGSHCSRVVRNDLVDWDWGCVWDDPLSLGENCEGLNNQSCAEGLCVSVNDADSFCGKFCDPNADESSIYSCNSLCVNDYVSEESFGICL